MPSLVNQNGGTVFWGEIAYAIGKPFDRTRQLTSAACERETYFFMFKKIASVVALSGAFVTGVANVTIHNANAASITRSATTTSQGEAVAAYAEQFLGTMYTHGGKSPQTGFDCSGFAYYVYKHFGINLSTGPAGQMQQGRQVSKSDMQPGDIVFFRSDHSRSGYHEGIYIGNNEFIHAVSPGRPVQITNLNSSWYQKRFLEVRRYF